MTRPAALSRGVDVPEIEFTGGFANAGSECIGVRIIGSVQQNVGWLVIGVGSPNRIDKLVI